MRNVDLVARALAFCLLIAAWTDSNAVDFVAPSTDGWHVWKIEASQDGARNCCYSYNDGDLSRQGCHLDGDGGYGITQGDCDLESGHINVYVRISEGIVTRIRALDSNCPVSTKDPVNSIGEVDASSSAAWLLDQVDAVNGKRRISEDAMAAISAHRADIALRTLTSILEDRSRRQKIREQALFWLAQIESDAAFEYIDALLSRT